MIDMAPFITFYGRCREALEFYSYSLQGQVRNCITFGEAKFEIQEDYNDKILSAFFQAQGLMFYASDGIPGHPIATGGNVALQVESSDKDDLRNIYSRLKEGGKEVVPLKIEKDGVLFGVVCDKYGVYWRFLGFN